MNVKSISSPSSAARKIDPAEWEARVKLAACYRMVAKLGMDDLIYNHISARVPGHDDQFLINPYGLLFDEITASTLVKINIKGDKLNDTPHNFCSTMRRQPGILMDVHPGLLLRASGCLAAADSLERARMDNPPADNLVRLHS